MATMMLCALAAQAQTVYKCTVNGKVSYGEQPCTNGRGTTLAVPPAPNIVDLPDMLKGEKARLAAFREERASREARAEKESRRAARAHAAKHQKCARLRLKATWLEEDAARAGKATAASARLKAQRQAQALGVECPA